MLNERVAKLETQVAGLTERMDRTLARIDRLEKRLWLLGLFIVAGSNMLEVATFFGAP